MTPENSISSNSSSMQQLQNNMRNMNCDDYDGVYYGSDGDSDSDGDGDGDSD
eukprot:CAMPEP_0171044522 /NCGR_PEP_ID=MMETSP0736-20130129/47848_1 /TAXON_ID=186038 /ORGANISM="Fragilariopsis kerguelensis, Strain L26-C5" /LENGTH=51 /DNA_ID=CAMNT_0011494105 /DNA_START=58 /DNA_END=210 /DNA_ORIENTATION=+